ncbi:MAG: chemotaxis protein CheW [Pontibacterium sp.]
MGLENAAEHLQEYLNNATKGPAKQAKQDDVVYHQWATFKVDNELYGVDVIKVKEVLRFSQMTPVPGAENYVLGIINLRGNVVTVIDTRQLFGLPAVPIDSDTRIIVVDYNEQEVVGLVVDSVDEVINLPQNDMERAPSVASEESARRFVQGVCYYNNLLIILLDLVKMMNSITPADLEDNSPPH